MTGLLISVFISLTAVFLSVKNALAADITISNPNLDSISDFNNVLEADVTLNIEASDNTKYYLRGMFYKTGTNKYCGYTWNGLNWYNGPYGSKEGWKNLPGITVSSGSGELRIKAKLDIEDEDCTHTGDYRFKLQRYTEGGSSSVDNQNELNLKVSVDIPTATLKPESTPPPTPVSATITSSGSQIVSSSPAPRPTLTTIIINSASISALAVETPDLNEDTNNFVNKNATVAGITKKKSDNFPYFSLISGIGLIFYSSYLSFRKIKNLKTDPLS